ncbi:Transposon Ty3-G Gag-Pol poly [Paramuricea clavata]|uniref:Transposon Ty3-G Gag-Pol poly n=1 Tax=Paramuricea clavata TaxID=317549 RepID=A0A7D9EDP8_PARCT|nr:Transposon Ty3-G Gag-Pol poly [Paramuricea clavata]
MKKSGSLRICIDPKPLNAALKREHYQIPVIDDLLPDLTDACVFTKVDLASAFWNLELDEESSVLTTFATLYCRFKWLRLPFGLNVSSEIFQKRLNHELEALPGVKCIADDVLIYGTSEADHDRNLANFMCRCQHKGMKLNPQKLEFKCKEVPFHGHLLTTEGLKADPEKVGAIREMPRPENQRRRVTPKRDVLAYYQLAEQLEIQCDSSQSGLGAALIQNGQPIAYASRALTETESRYAQIEKELLAVVVAVEKFNDYTFGRKTIVHSDHKPLQSILKKPLHRAPKRLKGMILLLQKYNVEVRYQSGKTMLFADTLSRAYVPETTGQGEPEFETINMLKYLPISEERLLQIQRETENDESLQVLKAVIQQGWPEQKSALPNIISPYYNMRDEMSVQNGLIFKGERVVVPRAIRSVLMKRVHNAHLDVNGCLNRARECLYWPGMSGDIKNCVSTCEVCREYERSQTKETLMSHEVPSRPWQRVAADLFEHAGRTYLVTTDYFSDFFELDHLRRTTSTSVIKKLKAHFSRHGIPEQLVTDNGPQFVSRDFVKFAKEWDFDSPRHSQANEKAESAVKEAKKIIMKRNKAGTDTFLALLDHRNTPSVAVQISPAQRLFSRRTRSLLPMSAELLKPKEGDSVRIKPWKLGKKEWQPGSIRKRLDERFYEVQTPCGILRRNRVHLRRSDLSLNNNDAPTQNPVTRSPREPITSTPVIVPTVELSLPSTSTTIPPSPTNEQDSSSSGHTKVRRSQRLRRLPTHLKDFVLK